MKTKLLILRGLFCVLCSLALTGFGFEERGHGGHGSFQGHASSRGGSSHLGGGFSRSTHNDERQFRGYGYYDDYGYYGGYDGYAYDGSVAYQCIADVDDDWVLGTAYSVSGPCYVNYDGEAMAVYEDWTMYP